MSPPEARSLLARFSQWLDQTAAEAERAGRHGDGPSSLPSHIDIRPFSLYQLVEEFTALRQEIKLQTKGFKSAQDQFEAASESLKQAMDRFDSVKPDEEQAAWSRGKPLAEALADLDEALRRTASVIDQARKAIVEESGKRMDEALNAIFARQPWLFRKTQRRYQAQVREAFRAHGLEVRQQFFETLVEGFSLIMKRLDRVMKSEQIQRIQAVGRPADPSMMNVVEAVEDPERAPGTVVEEVRRGYTWKGRVFRFAEVRAVRGPSASGLGES